MQRDLAYNTSGFTLSDTVFPCYHFMYNTVIVFYYSGLRTRSASDIAIRFYGDWQPFSLDGVLTYLLEGC